MKIFAVRILSLICEDWYFNMVSLQIKACFRKKLLRTAERENFYSDLSAKSLILDTKKGLHFIKIPASVDIRYENSPHR